jgi:hypothetical protein
MAPVRPPWRGRSTEEMLFLLFSWDHEGTICIDAEVRPRVNCAGSSRADSSRADLKGADLSRADLSHSDLKCADPNQATLLAMWNRMCSVWKNLKYREKICLKLKAIKVLFIIHHDKKDQTLPDAN